MGGIVSPLTQICSSPKPWCPWRWPYLVKGLCCCHQGEMRSYWIKAGPRSTGVFSLFKAEPAAYRSSQARGWIRAAAAGLHHGLNNTRSELHLWPTPQLVARPICNPQSWARPGWDLPPHRDYVGFLTFWTTVGTPTGVMTREPRKRLELRDRGKKAKWRQRQLGWHKPRNAGSHQKLENAKKDYYLEPLEEAWPCWHISFRVLASRTVRSEKNPFLVFCLLFFANLFVIFCSSSSRKLIHIPVWNRFLHRMNFFFFFFFVVFLPFLGLFPWYMEVPRLGV